jgi:L-lysine 2,3-aminomutase
MTKRAKYITDIRQIHQLSPEETRELGKVTKKFPFKANTYYLSLINWDDEADPIKRMIIPNPDEGKDEA